MDTHGPVTVQKMSQEESDLAAVQNRSENWICLNSSCVNMCVCMIGMCEIRYKMRWRTASALRSMFQSWYPTTSTAPFWMLSVLSVSVLLACCVTRSRMSCLPDSLHAFSLWSVADNICSLGSGFKNISYHSLLLFAIWVEIISLLEICKKS